MVCLRSDLKSHTLTPPPQCSAVIKHVPSCQEARRATGTSGCSIASAAAGLAVLASTPGRTPWSVVLFTLQEVFSKNNWSDYANTLSCKLQLGPSFLSSVVEQIKRQQAHAN